MTHPLTDEICDQIQDSVHPCDPEDMRAAADWQLEQVIEWFRANDYLGYQSIILQEKLILDLRKAMRPQQQEDN